MKYSAYVVGLLSVFLIACSSTDKFPQKQVDASLRELTGQDGKACLKNRDIRGYGVLSNSAISIDGGRKYYIATVRPGCLNLQTSFRVAFEKRFDEVCGGGLHKLFPGDGENCIIRAIYEFNDRASALLDWEAATNPDTETKE